MFVKYQHIYTSKLNIISNIYALNATYVVKLSTYMYLKTTYNVKHKCLYIIIDVVLWTYMWNFNRIYWIKTAYAVEYMLITNICSKNIWWLDIHICCLLKIEVMWFVIYRNGIVIVSRKVHGSPSIDVQLT